MRLGIAAPVCFALLLLAPMAHAERTDDGGGGAGEGQGGCSYTSPPGMVSGFQVDASNSTCSSVRLTWLPTPNAESYRIERLSDGCAYSSITGTTFDFPVGSACALRLEDQYYRIESVNCFGSSAQGAWISGAHRKPPTVTSTATYAAFPEVQISWAVSSSVGPTTPTKFQIFRRESSSGGETAPGADDVLVVDNISPDASSWPYSESVCGPHRYGVRGVNECGAGNLSWATGATNTCPVDPVASGLTVTAPPHGAALCGPVQTFSMTQASGLCSCPGLPAPWYTPCFTQVQLQVASDPNFANLVRNETLTPAWINLATSVQVAGLAAGSSYYWRIRGTTNRCGLTFDWSAVRYFTIADPIPLTATCIDNTSTPFGPKQLSVAAAGGCPPIAYEWQGGSSCGTDPDSPPQSCAVWTSLGGETSASYTCSACPTRIRCKVSDGAGAEALVYDFPPAQPQASSVRGPDFEDKQSSPAKSLREAEGITRLEVNHLSGTIGIRFNLHDVANVSFSVLDVNGRRVGDRVSHAFASGEHFLRMRPTGVNPGIYWILMTTDHARFTKQVFLTK